MTARGRKHFKHEDFFSYIRVSCCDSDLSFFHFTLRRGRRPSFISHHYMIALLLSPRLVSCTKTVVEDAINTEKASTIVAVKLIARPCLYESGLKELLILPNLGELRRSGVARTLAFRDMNKELQAPYVISLGDLEV